MSRESWDHACSADAHAHAHGHASASMSSSELAGFIAGSASVPGRAVDLGCGTGADAVFLAELGIDMVGVDYSERALEHARERAARHGVEVEWLHGDVLDLPLPDASFDLVLDHGCLHHVAEEHHRRYASEVARIVRPGGTLLVRERNHAGHHAPTATEESIRSMSEGTPLRVRHVVEFDRGLLAVLDRP